MKTKKLGFWKKAQALLLIAVMLLGLIPALATTASAETVQLAPGTRVNKLCTGHFHSDVQHPGYTTYGVGNGTVQWCSQHYSEDDGRASYPGICLYKGSDVIMGIGVSGTTASADSGYTYSWGDRTATLTSVTGSAGRYTYTGYISTTLYSGKGQTPNNTMTSRTWTTPFSVTAASGDYSVGFYYSAEASGPVYKTFPPNVTASSKTYYVGQGTTPGISYDDGVRVTSGYSNLAFSNYRGSYPGSVSLVSDGDLNLNKVGRYERTIQAVDGKDGSVGYGTQTIYVRDPISASKTPSVGAIEEIGQAFSWNITLFNAFTSTGYVNKVVDTVPAGFTIVSASDGAVISGQTVTWSGLSVPAATASGSGYRTLSINVTVDATKNGAAWVDYEQIFNSAEITTPKSTFIATGVVTYGFVASKESHIIHKVVRLMF